MDTRDYLTLGVGAAIVYALWKSKEKIEAGSDFIAEPIANAIISVTMPGELKLTGNALFPNGYRVAMSQLNIDPSTLTFRHLGIKYRIDHREGNDYIVVNA